MDNMGFMYKITCSRAVNKLWILKKYQIAAMTMLYDPNV